MQLETAGIEDVVMVRGTPVPAGVRFRQILTTGPPGSGKGTLVSQIGGWPEEGFLDLASPRWWRESMLSLRPREVHLGLPCVGHRESLAVTDEEWLATMPATELHRICIPPPKRGWLGTDWRGRYAFDFQLLPAELIFEARRRREQKRSHPVDRGVTLEQVQRQLHAYQEVALHLHRNGLTVYVREEFLGHPRRIVDSGPARAAADGGA